MNILKSINAGFTKLWRWIKETAWVQPLLIVGGIFAIIFSISKFNSWFSVMAVGTNSGYFTSYRLSLENEGKEDYETATDKLAATINDFSFGEYEDYASLKAALDKENVISTYGVKYYLIFVEQECAGCTNAEDAFYRLSNNWNTPTFKIEDGNSFRMHAIFADESSTNDIDYALAEDQAAFNRFVKKFDDRDLWARAGGKLEVAPYKENKGISETKYEHLVNAEYDNWETPSIFLVDWTEAAFNAGRFGISEVLFGFTTGTSDFERATLLENMWNHVPQSNAEEAKDTGNPFREEFKS